MAPSSAITTASTISPSASAKVSASAAGKPLYVLSIDPEKNRVVVGDDDALRTTSFEVNRCKLGFDRTALGAVRATVKIRHKHEPAAATVEALGDSRARITFDAPQRAITPGQGAVFYDARPRPRRCLDSLRFLAETLNIRSRTGEVHVRNEKVI